MGKLEEFIKSCADRPFVWGQFDCLRFANEGVRAQRGTGFADEVLGDYSTVRGAMAHYMNLTKPGNRWSSIVDLADDRLEREATLHPRAGWVVCRNERLCAPFGACIGLVVDQNDGAFLSLEGVVILPHKHDDLYWSIN
jgi:hypothetical protein